MKVKILGTKKAASDFNNGIKHLHFNKVTHRVWTTPNGTEYGPDVISFDELDRPLYYYDLCTNDETGLLDASYLADVCGGFCNEVYKYKVNYNGKSYTVIAEDAGEAIDKLADRQVFGNPLIGERYRTSMIDADTYGKTWAEAYTNETHRRIFAQIVEEA